MSTTVQLGNQTFHYNNTKADHERRTLYFKHQSGADLDASEREILDALGIDKATEESLAPHLADFFYLLPNCSTPTSLMLDKKCELPYYVLWSIMFANKHATEKRLETQAMPPSELNIIKAAALIDELKPSVPPTFIAPGSATEKLVGSTAKINKLFTLMFTTTPAATSGPLLLRDMDESETIRRIFTLLLV